MTEFSAVGAEFIVNTQTLRSQVDPTVTTLANGNFVVSWLDYSALGGDSSGSSIKAQIFNATGAKIGSEFLVNSITQDYQYNPNIAALDNGGFVIVWDDYSGALGDTSYGGIAAQVFDASGAKVGKEFAVNTNTAFVQVGPSVTGLANGSFVVSWWDYSGTLGDNSLGSIKAQVFTASGAKIGTEFLVNTTTQNAQFGSSTTALADGGFVVIWEDGYQNSVGQLMASTIKAQVFDAAGAKVGNEFLVNNVTSDQVGWPIVTGLHDGGFVVAWSQHGATSEDGSVQAQLFDAIGARIGSDFRVDSPSVGAKSYPAVAAMTDGGFLVSWEDTSGTLGDRSGPSIKAQLFDAAGGKVGSEHLVNSQTIGGQEVPAVTGLADGHFVVVWQDEVGTYFPNNSTLLKAQIFQPGIDDATIHGTSGNDVITPTQAPAGEYPATAGDDIIAGKGGDDIINAGAGNDILDGGQGRDDLTGGAGADIFRYAAQDDSRTGSLNRDVIRDFAVGEDKIKLTAAFGEPGHLVDSFTGHAGEIRQQVYSIGWVMLSVDYDGDARADMQINVHTGGALLTADDFILI